MQGKSFLRQYKRGSEVQSRHEEANRTLCRHHTPSSPISERFQETEHTDGCCLQATAVDRLAYAWVHLSLCPLAWAPGDASAPLAYSCRCTELTSSLIPVRCSSLYKGRTITWHCGRPNRPIPAPLPDQGPQLSNAAVSDIGGWPVRYIPEVLRRASDCPYYLAGWHTSTAFIAGGQESMSHGMSHACLVPTRSMRKTDTSRWLFVL